MKKQHIKIKGDPFNYILRLIKAEKTFKFEITSASGKVEIDDKVILFGNRWKAEVFGLFQKTKKHLKSVPIPDAPKGRIKYIGIKPPEAAYSVLKNVMGVDINSAYHQAAKQLGYFDDEIFIAHKKSEKKTRLQSFGATAKRAEVFSYVSGKMVDNEVVESELRPFFLNCAEYVGDVLHEVRSRLGNDFLFYWVDCAYFKNTQENINIVSEIFEKHGFSYHFDPSDFIIFEAKKKTYKIRKVANGVEKCYNFSRFDKRISSKNDFYNKLKN